MTKEEVKTLIDAKITENNAGEITATDLKTILSQMVEVHEVY